MPEARKCTTLECSVQDGCNALAKDARRNERWRQLVYTLANTHKQGFTGSPIYYCVRASQCHLLKLTMQSDIPNGFEERLRQRAAAQQHPLQTIPSDPTVKPRGMIPNTPLAASTISFVLGALFALGTFLFLTGGIQGVWWATPQLGFFVAVWSAFHWGEFAVTAGWNLSKCSVDCTSH